MPLGQPPIEDEILRTLLMINSTAELDADQRSKMKVLKEEINSESETEAETDVDVGESAEQKLEPDIILKLVLKPVLQAALLELLAKLLNNDPEARKALIKLLTATNTPGIIRKALTHALAEFMDRGYTHAAEVLREAYSKSKEPDYFIKMVRVASPSCADTLQSKPRLSAFPPIPKPKSCSFGPMNS